MSDKVPNIDRIAVASHPHLIEAEKEAAEIAAFLEARGCNTIHGLLDDETLKARVRSGEFDLLIALGGDGTMLRAGHLCAPIGVPILGTSLGGLDALFSVAQMPPGVPVACVAIDGAKNAGMLAARIITA